VYGVAHMTFSVDDKAFETINLDTVGERAQPLGV
jgi:hypothetical protein